MAVCWRTPSRSFSFSLLLHVTQVAMYLVMERNRQEYCVSFYDRELWLVQTGSWADCDIPSAVTFVLGRSSEKWLDISAKGQEEKTWERYLYTRIKCWASCSHVMIPALEEARTTRPRDCNQGGVGKGVGTRLRA